LENIVLTQSYIAYKVCWRISRLNTIRFDGFLRNINSIYFLMKEIFLTNADSQQYIFTIRIDLIISDIILIRSSVIWRIFVLEIIIIRRKETEQQTVFEQKYDCRILEQVEEKRNSQ